MIKYDIIWYEHKRKDCNFCNYPIPDTIYHYFFDNTVSFHFISILITLSKNGANSVNAKENVRMLEEKKKQ